MELSQARMAALDACVSPKLATRMRRAESAPRLKRALSGTGTGRLNLARGPTEELHSPGRRPPRSPSFGPSPVSQMSFLRGRELSPPPPFLNVYANHDSEFIGMLKADIQAIRGRIDDIRGKADNEASDLIRTIAQHTASEDPQKESHSRLFLLEVRDHQMRRLEVLLHDKLSILTPGLATMQSSMRDMRPSFFSPRQTGARVTTYVALIDLLLALASQSQEFRGVLRDRDTALLAVEAQLRSLLKLLEEQSTQILDLQRTLKADRAEMENGFALERSLAHQEIQDLKAKLVDMEDSMEELIHAQQLPSATSVCGLDGLPSERERQDNDFHRLTSLAVCDRCAAWDAECSSLRMMNAELGLSHKRALHDKADAEKAFKVIKAELDATKAERDRLVMQNLEKDRRAAQDVQQMQSYCDELQAQHQYAVDLVGQQEELLLSLQGFYMGLARSQVLQAEAGERIALTADAEAGAHTLYQGLWTSLWRAHEFSGDIRPGGEARAPF